MTVPMQNAIAIRHVSFEDVGILEDVLAKRGIALTLFRRRRR